MRDRGPGTYASASVGAGCDDDRVAGRRATRGAQQRVRRGQHDPATVVVVDTGRLAPRAAAAHRRKEICRTASGGARRVGGGSAARGRGGKRALVRVGVGGVVVVWVGCGWWVAGVGGWVGGARSRARAGRKHQGTGPGGSRLRRGAQRAARRRSPGEAGSVHMPRRGSNSAAHSAHGKRAPPGSLLTSCPQLPPAAPSCPQAAPSCQRVHIQRSLGS